MQLPPIVRPFVVIAGSSGIIQSTIWLTLAIISVINSQACVFQLQTFLPSQLLASTLGNVYFLSEDCAFHSALPFSILKPYQIFIWSIIYIVLSLVWLCASILLLIFVTTKRIKFANMAIYTWCLITLGLSSVDIALGILFAQDFYEMGPIMDAYNPIEMHIDLIILYSIRLAAGLLSVIALRGFILLAMNVGLLIFLFYCTFKISDELNKSVHTTTQFGPIHGYGTAESNLNRSMSQRGVDNRTFDFNEDLMIPRSNSWHQGKINPHSPRQNGTPQSQQQPSGFQSNNYPQEQQPWRPIKPVLKPVAINPTAPNRPSLPTPDYSPPAFRRLKSALKSTGPV